jgi:hypothetical protein
MTPQDPHAESLRRLADFALAQVFRPEAAAQQAVQVLLPARDMLPAGHETPAQQWISVEALVTQLSATVYTAVYEVSTARLMRGLLGLSRDWPTLWREAVVVHVRATFGLDFTDATQLCTVEQEAHAALWEAHRALYGSPHDER